MTISKGKVRASPQHGRCKTCAHPQRRDIELDFMLRRKTMTEFKPAYDIHYQSVYDHMKRHIDDTYRNLLYAEHKSLAAGELVKAETVDVVSSLQKIAAEAEKMFAEARDTEDTKSAIALLKEIRQQIELAGRFMKDMQASNLVVLPQHPQWVKLRQIILEVLDEYPEARTAFISKIGALALT